MLMKFFASLIIYSLMSMICLEASLLEEYSLKAPFKDVDAQGKRILSKDWLVGGSTEVKENFIRLTPDRQSKRGYLWQNQAIGSDEFSAVIEFRISGQGKRWFGDGIGLWFTESRYVAGENHGFAEKFKGVGIILDTFRNTDHQGGHKDVAVMVNDGTKDLDQLNSEKKIGCDASIRFHEEHAGFSPVFSASRVKIEVKGSRLKIRVDEKSEGKWKDCFEGDVALPANWATNARFGITGSTGALADNHDIIRTSIFSQVNDPDASVVDSEALLNNISKDYDQWLDNDSCGSECKVAILTKKMKDFKIDFEHRMTDLKEKTQNTIDKLKNQEQDNEKKIVILERKVAGMVDRSMNKKMENIGKNVEEKIKKTVEDNVIAQGSSWKTPFFLLCVGLSGGAVFVYKKYNNLRKSHLL